MSTQVSVEGRKKILQAISEMNIGQVNLMEVCGTHTMAIAKSGLKSVLPSNIKLLSGPGCPVCVTPNEVLDAILALAMEKNVTIATYGDMIRVPGSRQGENLAKCRAEGASIEIVYSALDAVEIAKQDPKREVVFLGAGFETTAPGTAMAAKVAAEQNVRNFSVLSMLKRVEPALRALISDSEFNVQGFLCPGHVATIIGEEGFRFLTEEFHIPAVISGFEPEDILISVYKLAKQIKENNPHLENEYTRAVMPQGNQIALNVMDEMLEARDDLWRGLGMIPLSGYKLKPEYAAFDAEIKFGLDIKPSNTKSACRCGDVIQGKIGPKDCPMFGKVCLPENPAGPCMVSSEGACAAEYKYNS